MPAAGKEVTAAATFGLKMGGAEADGLFQSISGLGSSIAAVQHKSVDAKGKVVYSSIPGSKQDWSEITITRAFNEGKAIYQWHRDIIMKGIKGLAKDITVEFLDNQRKPVATWNVKQAWPCTHSIDGVAAGNDSPLTETFTLTHSGIERK